VAIQDLLHSPADGRTIMMLSPTSLVINPLLNEHLPYDAQRDLRPVAGMIRTTAVLVTGGNSRFNKFADVVAAARKNPQTISMASYSQHYRLGRCDADGGCGSVRDFRQGAERAGCFGLRPVPAVRQAA